MPGRPRRPWCTAAVAGRRGGPAARRGGAGGRAGGRRGRLRRPRPGCRRAGRRSRTGAGALRLGFACVERGVSYLAVPALREALRHSPGSLAVLRELVSAYEDEGRHREARDEVVRHADALDDWPDRYLFVFNALMAGDLETAPRQHALLRDPEDPAGGRRGTGRTGCSPERRTPSGPARWARPTAAARGGRRSRAGPGGRPSGGGARRRQGHVAAWGALPPGVLRVRAEFPIRLNEGPAERGGVAPPAQHLMDLTGINQARLRDRCDRLMR